MDASRIDKITNAAIGGVKRDDKSKITFATSIGDVPAPLAEWWLFARIGLTRNRKIRNMEVESDIIQVIWAISEGMYYSRLITLQEIWEECNNFHR